MKNLRMFLTAGNPGRRTLCTQGEKLRRPGKIYRLKRTVDSGTWKAESSSRTVDGDWQQEPQSLKPTDSALPCSLLPFC
jgi:hypothetical protein